MHLRHHRPTGHGLVLALLLAVSACAQAPDTKYAPVADVKQVMNTVLEPAAEVYWDAVGWVVDSAGTHELMPATPEEWQAVRSAAFVVAESGNLLMMERPSADGRLLARQDVWQAMARAMVDVGKRAIAAAEARDRDAVFSVGGDVYEVCTACHAAYATETLRPSDARR